MLGAYAAHYVYVYMHSLLTEVTAAWQLAHSVRTYCMHTCILKIGQKFGSTDDDVYMAAWH